MAFWAVGLRGVDGNSFGGSAPFPEPDLGQEHASAREEQRQARYLLEDLNLAKGILEDSYSRHWYDHEYYPHVGQPTVPEEAANNPASRSRGGE